jgi:hypothetical protein
MHGQHIGLHIEDEGLSPNKKTGYNAKRSERKVMPQEVEANTGPEELSSRKNFKERHDRCVMAGDGIHGTNFFQFYSREVMIREKNIRQGYRTCKSLSRL